MGQDPDAIREDIAATREHMGETIDALVERAHGSARARQRLVAARDALVGKATATKNGLVGRVRGYASHPDQAAEQAKTRARRTSTGIRDNPRSLAGAAGTLALLAAGFVVMATRARRGEVRRSRRRQRGRARVRLGRRRPR